MFVVFDNQQWIINFTDCHSRPADLYHTCYTLSGAAVAQHCETSKPPLILGNPDNELLPTHPLHNVPPKAVIDAYKYFLKNELIEAEHSNGQCNGDEATTAVPASADVEEADVEMRESSVESERSSAASTGASTTTRSETTDSMSGTSSQRSSEERSESVD